MQTEIQERPRHHDEPQARTPHYSPTMSDAEIETLIARLDRNSEERAHAQTRLTDSVKSIRTMRAERTKHLRRLGGNADRR
ncbi:MAG: hypothetical protein ACYDAR_06735 [Thermomicrobiales bacterium]